MDSKRNNFAPSVDKLLGAFPWFVFSMAIALLVVVSFVNMDIVISANIKNYSIYVAVNAIANWSIYFAFKQRSYTNGVMDINGGYSKNFNNYLEEKGKIRSSQSFNEYVTYRELQLRDLYVSDTARIVGVESASEVATLDYKDKKKFPLRDQRNRIYNVQHNLFPRCGWSYNDIMYLGQDMNTTKLDGLIAYQDVDRNKGKRIATTAISAKGCYTLVGAMFAGSIAGSIALNSEGWVGMVIKIIISILFFIQAINAGNTLGKQLVVIDKDALGSASIAIAQYEEWLSLEIPKPTSVDTKVADAENKNNENDT